MYERVRQTGQAETIETLFELPDGRPIWLEGRACSLAQERLAIFFRDITARKLIEQELAESNRRQDEFLAMLAHELRNPLAPIRAAADVLAMGRLDAARIEKLSRVISRQVTHMTGLLDDLMDVSRVTRGLLSWAPRSWMRTPWTTPPSSRCVRPSKPSNTTWCCTCRRIQFMYAATKYD